MEIKLTVGDLVLLKGGGPIMTVTHVSACENFIDCMWFLRGAEKSFELEKGTFPLKSLKVYIDKQSYKSS